MRTYFLYRVLASCMAALIRRVALPLVLGLLFTLLAGSAPAPQACNESNAAFVIRTTIFRDVPSNGTTVNVPAGQAAAWSCVSQADADAELARQVAMIK